MERSRSLKGKLIALDVETDWHEGFGFYQGSRLFCWSYMTELGEYGFMEKTPANIEWVRGLFNDPAKTLIFHNAKYDLKAFGFEGIDIYNMKAKVDCTLILSKLLNMGGQHDLQWLAYRYLGRDTSDKTEIYDWMNANRREFRKKHGRAPTFMDAPREIIKRRNLWDVESTILLHQFLKPRIVNICAELYQTEVDLMFCVIDMENYGVQVDVSRAKALRKQAESDVDKITRDLNKLVCPFKIIKKKRKEEREVIVNQFNPNSSAKHLPAAFEKLGIELKYVTKPKKGKKGGESTGGGKWCFDEYAMIRYVAKELAAVIRESGEDGWPAGKFYDAIYAVMKKHKLDKKNLLPPLVLKFRELSKMCSTYYSHLIDDVTDLCQTPTGKWLGVLHCNFNQSEAMTGRFSSSNPNLQNIPRIMGPRECFVPRQGRRNWHFDYDQVEMKMFVHYAEDPKMAEAIKTDIHLHVAAEIYNEPKENISKEKRKRAKGVNFGIIYGSGGPTMAETLTKKGLPTSRDEGTRLVANYHRKFPSVRRINNELKVRLHRDGFVTNRYGRRYHIPTKFAYKALNYLCQGSSADEMKRAMVAIYKWLRKNGFKARLIMTVHDEIVLEIPRSEEHVVVPGVIKIMENLTGYYVPITVGVEINDSRWSNKKDPKDMGLQFSLS